MAAALLLMATALPMFSQNAATTSLAGTVADATGGRVVNASLELVNRGTHLTKRSSSGAQGRFLFILIPPGIYDLTVSAPGFSSVKQEGITLDVDVPGTVHVSLAVAGAAQQVTVAAVAADTPMVDTESGTLRQVVSEKYIQELPLNGRNAATLVFMAPGTVTGKGQDPGTYATTSDTIAVSVNGTFGDQVSYNLDGASHQDSISNLNAAFPNPDALAEFSVQTNNFDAQYGGSGGAVVNIVTKSGTNSLHGTLFEYIRNGDVNARNFFAPVPDALKRNQFGASAGGPIKKDKLFFFGSYQGTILSDITYGNTAFVPTAAQKGGDFSTGKAIIDPTTKLPFPGAIIPASRISPIAAKMMPDVPSAVSASGSLLHAIPSSSQNHQELAKVDYYTGAHQLTASYFHIHYTSPGWDGDDTLFNYVIGQDQTTHSFKAGDTWAITPTLVNSLTFGGLILNSVQTRTAPFSIFDFGAIAAAKPVPQFQETGITVTGFSGWGSGGSQPPGDWIRDNFEISEVLSWNRGGHAMKMGTQFTPWTRFDSNTGYEEEPLLNFNGSVTGNGLADLLLGSVNTYTQTAGKVKFTRGRADQRLFPGQLAHRLPPDAQSGDTLGALYPVYRSSGAAGGGLHPRRAIAALSARAGGTRFCRRSQFPRGCYRREPGELLPALRFRLDRHPREARHHRARRVGTILHPATLRACTTISCRTLPSARRRRYSG